MCILAGNGKTSIKEHDMSLESLKNPELQEKLRDANTPEDIFEIVKTEGVDLTEDDLKALAAGTSLEEQWNDFVSGNWS